jgi:bifunctional N-acetylglucosamine-1-phosphate-uridyltransferase/glucosamine-1-phosphate-acetyltransferase GlmU-like protein
MAGKPLLGHVLDTLDELGVARVVAVIGHQRERVEAAFAGRPRLEWAIQAEQRGTGHACMMAEPVLARLPAPCWWCAATRRCSPRRHCTSCSSGTSAAVRR